MVPATMTVVVAMVVPRVLEDLPHRCTTMVRAGGLAGGTRRPGARAGEGDRQSVCEGRGARRTKKALPSCLHRQKNHRNVIVPKKVPQAFFQGSGSGGLKPR